MKKKVILLGLLTGIVTQPVLAGNKEILATLQTLDIPATEVKIYPTDFQGVSVAMTNRGTFYVSEDGRFISQGPIYEMKSGTPRSIIRDAVRNQVASLTKDAITYKAANEKAKVVVFTDISCTFCQKLHENIAEYNKQGITIQYLAFPRQGLQSAVGKQMQAIWNAPDKKAALEKGFRGEPIAASTNLTTDLASQVNVGRQLNITGTPTLVLANGDIIGGFVSAQRLKEIINRNL